ncbi:RhuM family protein [Roseibacillus persicicus]|uniref:Virulence protein RhuM family protein n=1 Tax=Roseibacillus persicicus TaxID=454148 RepID=A0A918TL43_9BACT|nr:RhuM family protein [Roseibacillus persicicus]GHC49870.1 hypothetical protein GCM10007100_14770 [Roseibacillus persicicus]
MSEVVLNTTDDGRTRLDLRVEAASEEFLTVKAEGNREIQRLIQLFNLDFICAISYRGRFPHGLQFRKWASSHIKEHLVKGFLMDDERLKNSGDWKYFDELPERIREIRPSEKRFYQKVHNLSALNRVYQTREEGTSIFSDEAQNKLLYAATQHTPCRN